MDSGTIFYIIAIIIYFIYTSFIQKKAEKPTSDQEESDAKPPQKGPSFDDLLREIRNEQGQRERDMDASGEPEEVTYAEKTTAEEVEAAEYRTENQENYKKNQEAYKNPYQDLKQPLVKLDDQVDLADDKKLLGEVEDVAAENPGNSKYARLLKNPASARDAVILTEIFNRRHF
ncbi:hypothetical protein [Cyclobacterium salsum]|uniref:hypothetical protein n=1 Tax=Cyclobacterium salsum TaxID=2666329 RepID=UPI001391A001|nr:hypothetical protein [Cyclobacterium salsum]